MHSQRRRRVLAVTDSEVLSFAFRLATLATLLRFHSLEPKRRPRSALAPLQSYLRSRGRCVIALPATSPCTRCPYSRAPSFAFCLATLAMLLRFRSSCAEAATTQRPRAFAVLTPKPLLAVPGCPLSLFCSPLHLAFRRRGAFCPPLHLAFRRRGPGPLQRPRFQSP